ncbi:MAG: hypothetical protein HFE76_11685 [Firmicutes bacterium]|nr:hypothetical protein [Bacillota bacterium]
MGQEHRLLAMYADFTINRLTTMLAGKKFCTTKGHFGGILYSYFVGSTAERRAAWASEDKASA